jgi:hypothetical protein
MTKDDGFIDGGALGDLAGSRPLETLLGKQFCSHF